MKEVSNRILNLDVDLAFESSERSIRVVEGKPPSLEVQVKPS